MRMPQFHLSRVHSRWLKSLKTCPGRRNPATAMKVSLHRSFRTSDLIRFPLGEEEAYTHCNHLAHSGRLCHRRVPHLPMQMRSRRRGLQEEVPNSLADVLTSSILDLSLGRLAPSVRDQRLKLSLSTGGRLNWRAGCWVLPPYGRSTTRLRLSTPSPSRTFSNAFQRMSWNLLTQLSPRRTLPPSPQSSQRAPRRSISKLPQSA